MLTLFECVIVIVIVIVMPRQQVSATSAVTSRTRAVVWPLAQRVMELRGVFRPLPCVAFSFVSEAQTVSPSCLQMLCSNTLTQSGVGVNSSCGRRLPSATRAWCFALREYQAVSNETSSLTDRSDNTVSLMLYEAKPCLVPWRLDSIS